MRCEREKIIFGNHHGQVQEQGEYREAGTENGTERDWKKEMGTDGVITQTEWGVSDTGKGIQRIGKHGKSGSMKVEGHKQRVILWRSTQMGTERE